MSREFWAGNIILGQITDFAGILIWPESLFRPGTLIPGRITDFAGIFLPRVGLLIWLEPLFRTRILISPESLFRAGNPIPGREILFRAGLLISPEFSNPRPETSSGRKIIPGRNTDFAGILVLPEP